VALGDLSPADVQKYLEGLDFPASKEEVAATAESNGAPQALGLSKSGLWVPSSSQVPTTLCQHCH
jgi:hypothetical protein